MLEAPEKLVSTTTNPLIYHLIVKVSYAGSLLITTIIFIGIEFKLFKKANSIDDDSANLGKKTSLS